MPRRCRRQWRWCGPRKAQTRPARRRVIRSSAVRRRTVPEARCRCSVLPFPAFDPVLITIGPFAIRWYALAYIVGILVGWLYARALIALAALWGGPAPLTVVDFDDFVLWVTLGIILGGRIGYVLFYNLPLFRRAPARDPAAVERRHVVPRRLRSAASLAIVLFARAARHPDAVARRRDLRGRRRSACSSAASPISSTASCGAGRPTCRGRWCFPTAGRSRAIRASSTRRRSRALVLFVVLALLMRARRAQAARARHRRLRARLRRRPHHLRIVPRARRAARLSLGRPHHGHAAVAAADPRRHRLHRRRAAAREPVASMMADERSPLEAEIRRLIAVAGPMPVADYMPLCLTHPAARLLHRRAIRSAPAAISSPRRRSARCSAS